MKFFSPQTRIYGTAEPFHIRTDKIVRSVEFSDNRPTTLFISNYMYPDRKSSRIVRSYFDIYEKIEKNRFDNLESS